MAIRGEDKMNRKVTALLAAVMVITMTSCSSIPAHTKEETEETETTTEETETTTTTTEETSEATIKTEETTTLATTEEAAISESVDEEVDPFFYETSEPVITNEEDGIMYVDFYRDDLRMSAKIYLPDGEGPFTTVVLATGLRASCDQYTIIAEQLASDNIACVLFDFTGGPSGTSNSDGDQLDMCFTSEVKDLNAVLDGVMTLDITDTDNVFLFGHSFGGVVSTAVAATREDEIRGLILMEPAYQLKDIVTMFLPANAEIPEYVEYPFYLGRAFIEDEIEYDIYEYIPEYHGNVIMFMGTEGDALGLIGPQYFEEAQELFPNSELVVVEGANHEFDGDAGLEMYAQSLAFIEANIV